MRTTLFLLALGFSAAASAQSPLSIAQANAAAESKAVQTTDYAWFEKTETPSYVEFDKSGKRKTKAESLTEMKAMAPHLKIKSVTAKVLSAKTAGKDLVSTLDIHILASLIGPDGKAHSMDFMETAEETWTKVGGAWKIRLQKTTKESGKIDGRVVA